MTKNAEDTNETQTDKLSDEESYDQTEEIFQCTNCEKIYRSKHSLRAHMRSHTEDRPYACEVCKKKFQNLMLD